ELMTGQIGLSEHAAEKVVELVRDPSSEATNSFQLLSFDVLITAALQIRNVVAIANKTGEITVVSETREAASQHPAVFTISAALTVLKVEGLACIECRAIRGYTVIKVFRVDVMYPPVTQLVVQSTAREFKPGFVDKCASPVRA